MNRKYRVVMALAASMIAAPAAVTLAAGPAQPKAAMAKTAPAAQKTAAHAMKAHKAAASEEVKAIQEALNKQGANLKVDGIAGKKTRAALATFQKANGLKATGKADPATLAKLGIKP
jgi:peptidoglycan hydrolase-like protein with peptidoglycan-binding domain